MSSRSAAAFAATVLAFSTFVSAGEPPRPTATAAPSAAYLALREALASPFNLTIDECPLPELIEQLRQHYKIPIVLDTAAFDAKNGDGQATKIHCDGQGLRLRTALQCALKPHELCWTTHDDALLITTNECAEAMIEMRMYDVTDLVEPGSSFGLDALIELITGMVAPTTWSEVGGAGAIKSFRAGDVEILVIGQTGYTQIEIAELFDSLRAVRDAHGTAKASVSMRRQFAPQLAVEASPQRDAVVAAGTEFAIELYGRLRDRRGNLLISPYGISAALAMLYSGAGGETAKEIARVMHWRMPPSEVGAGFLALGAAFQRVDRDHRSTLHVANRLWGQQGVQFHAPYLKLLREDFAAEAQVLDFAHADAAHVVNAWVNEQTSGTIKTLVSQPIPPETSLLLANAVYFHSPWEQAFSRDDTSTPFHLGAKQVTVPFITRPGRHLYAEVEGVQILEEPYHNGAMSMVMILPPNLSGALDDLERSLTPDRLRLWLTAVRMQQVKVSLPKFKFATGTGLGSALEQLGMRRAFSPDDADFSGMAPPSLRIFVNRVLTEAAIEVNEYGTTAAAATALIGSFGGLSREPKVPVFLADRPFLFLIHDRRTGAILFFGRLSDPQHYERAEPRP